MSSIASGGVTRILLIIPDLADGGAQRQAITLFKELNNQPDLVVGLIYAHEGVNSDLLPRSEGDVYKLVIKSNYDLSAFRKVENIATKFRPDIVYTWLQSADLYGFYLKITRPNVKWIIAQRNSTHPNDFRFWLRGVTGRFADGIVSNSQAGVGYWMKRGFRGSTFIAPNILYPPSAPNRLRSDRLIKEIIYVGRFEPQKNVLNVCRAFCNIANADSSIRFQMIGAGSEISSLREIVETNNCTSRVTFPGFSKDVQSIMKSADLLVSMSHREGLPNVLLEAINVDLPVVASDIPEHRELLGEQFKHLVQKYDSSEAITVAVQSVIRDGYDFSELNFAKARLDEMRPANVNLRYRDIFKEILRSSELK